MSELLRDDVEILVVIHEGNDSGIGSVGDTRGGRGRKDVKGRDPIKLPQGCARYLFVSQFQWPGNVISGWS